MTIFPTLSWWAPVRLYYPSGKDPFQKEPQVLCYVALLWRRRQLWERRWPGSVMKHQWQGELRESCVCVEGGGETLFNITLMWDTMLYFLFISPKPKPHQPTWSGQLSSSAWQSVPGVWLGPVPVPLSVWYWNGLWSSTGCSWPWAASQSHFPSLLPLRLY